MFICQQRYQSIHLMPYNPWYFSINTLSNTKRWKVSSQQVHRSHQFRRSKKEQSVQIRPLISTTLTQKHVWTRDRKSLREIWGFFPVGSLYLQNIWCDVNAASASWRHFWKLFFRDESLQKIWSTKRLKTHREKKGRKKKRFNKETLAKHLLSSYFEIWTKTLLSAYFQLQFCRRSVGLIGLQHVFDLLGGSLIVQMFGCIPEGVGAAEEQE